MPAYPPARTPPPTCRPCSLPPPISPDLLDIHRSSDLPLISSRSPPISQVPTAYHTYPMEHSSDPSEMEDLRDWLGDLGLK